MTRRKMAQTQEISVAKSLNGRITSASGATPWDKADVKTEEFLFECKTTAKGFYSLTVKVWEKISKEAVRAGLKIPVMVIDLNSGGERIAVFEYDLYRVSDNPLNAWEQSYDAERQSIRVCGSSDIVFYYLNKQLLVSAPYSFFVDEIFKKVEVHN